MKPTNYRVRKLPGPDGTYANVLDVINGARRQAEDANKRAEDAPPPNLHLWQEARAAELAVAWISAAIESPTSKPAAADASAGHSSPTLDDIFGAMNAAAKMFGKPGVPIPKEFFDTLDKPPKKKPPAAEPFDIYETPNPNPGDFIHYRYDGETGRVFLDAETLCSKIASAACEVDSIQQFKAMRTIVDSIDRIRRNIREKMQ